MRGRMDRSELRGQRRWLLILGIALTIAAVLVTLLSGRRRVLFFAVAVPLLFAPFAYARQRLLAVFAEALAGRPGACRVLVGAGVIADLVMSAQLLTARAAEALPVLHGWGIEWVGPVWFSAHAIAALAYGLRGALHAVIRPLHWLARTLRRAVVTADPAPVLSDGADDAEPLSRRAFLRQFGVVGAAAPFAVSLSGVPLSYDFRVDTREIELPHWPRALDGLCIAHLSDIHVGGAMDAARLREVAALTAAARPDLIVHTGDFLTHRRGDFDAPLYAALATLAPPYGQWACLGNHDFDDPARLVRRLGDAGVVVLRDAVAEVLINGQRLEIAGLDFCFDREQRAAIAARRVVRWPARTGTPRILLQHDPSEFALLPAGCADLVCAGHTHGGHIGVQLGRDRALTVAGLAGYPDQGVFHRSDMRLFVTRCVGFYGYPMRVGIPPEIAILILRAPRVTTAPV